MPGNFGATISYSRLLCKPKCLPVNFLLFAYPQIRFPRKPIFHWSTGTSPDIKVPPPKIQKFEHNDVVLEDSHPSLFKVKKLSENVVLPSMGSLLSVGFDLSSAIEIKVPARGKALVATDLNIVIPKGTYARIAPRSGLACKHSIDVGADVIDADYRGPVRVTSVQPFRC